MPTEKTIPIMIVVLLSMILGAIHIPNHHQMVLYSLLIKLFSMMIYSSCSIHHFVVFQNNKKGVQRIPT